MSRLFDATVISENQIGLVEALDGAPLDPKDYVATPKRATTIFKTATPLLPSADRRGPQKDILLPGTYYINPMMFKVILECAKEVKPGEVAVIVSNTGKDPGEDIRQAMADKIRTSGAGRGAADADRCGKTRQGRRRQSVASKISRPS